MDGIADLEMSVDVISDGRCSTATISGDPYSSTFFLDSTGEFGVVGIEVSYPTRQLIGTDCRR